MQQTLSSTVLISDRRRGGGYIMLFRTLDGHYRLESRDIYCEYPNVDAALLDIMRFCGQAR